MMPRSRIWAALLAGAALLLACAGAARADTTVVATGAYPKGLLWHGGRMLFAEMGADRISVIEGGDKRTFWTDPGCGPTSIAPFGPSGFLVNCHLGRHVVEVSSDGVTGRRFRTDPRGASLQDPNASAGDGAGGVYFSDSGVFDTGAPATGKVYHLAYDGAMKEIAGNLRYPNGVAFDAGTRTLYVSEHLARRVLALQLDAGGRVQASAVFADFAQHAASRDHAYPLAGPDGIALRPGLLAVAEYGEGRVHLFDRAGRHQRTLAVAMPFVDTVAWDDAGRLFAGGAYSNVLAPYEGRVVRLDPADWQGAEPATNPQRQADGSILEREVQSEYSRIRIRRQGSLRSMIFVRDNGEEAYQSQVNLDRRDVLQYDYARFFGASFLFRPRQERVLIVGLGGGGFVHFLQKFSPQTQVDVIEIDPAVIQLADEFFGIRTGERINIIRGDGVRFFDRNVDQDSTRYDAIYLDAFLKPSGSTDDTGAPLDLRTQAFYRRMQAALKPGGLVAFNLNMHDGLEADLRNIIASFPQTYLFPIVNEIVAIGSLNPVQPDNAQLFEEARRLDRLLDEPTMRFEVIAGRMLRKPPAAPQ